MKWVNTGNSCDFLSEYNKKNIKEPNKNNKFSKFINIVKTNVIILLSQFMKLFL